MVFWPFSRKKNAKLLKKSERWPNKRSKVKTLESKPSMSEWPFFTKCVRNIIEKAVSICVIIPQNRKVKKFQLHIIDQSFEHNGTGISYQKKLESLEEKKAVHTSCKHGVRRICQLYTKGGPAGKLMWCEPPRDHLDYRRRDNIQRSSPQNTGWARQWLLFAWKNVTLDTLRELVHFIPHRLEIVRKHTERHSGY